MDSDVTFTSMTRRWCLLFTVACVSAAAPLGAGCLSVSAPPGEFAAEPLRSPVVVALVDIGINPYHSAFRTQSMNFDAGSFLTTLAMTGTASEVVALAAEGSYDERKESDAEFWSSTSGEVLYAFTGTRALGISFLDPAPDEFVIEGNYLGHGTGTAALVAREAPEVIVVVAQFYGALCIQRDELSCYDDPSAARAMQWIAAQPWIHIVSVSAGMRANLVPPPDASPELSQFIAASHAAVDSGKILVFGSGNDAAPAMASHYNGPPWVISAGGIEPAMRGESILAGKTPDVVANFTELRAVATTLDEYQVGSGTSYATPIVAGTLAKALSEIRGAIGHVGGPTVDGALAMGRTPDGRELRVTNRDLRAALNASATYFSPMEWNPTAPNGYNDTLSIALSRSVPVVAPAQQMGWGYVHAGLASEIARRVLEEDYSLPAAKATTVPWMRAQYEARAAYWGAVGP